MGNHSGKVSILNSDDLSAESYSINRMPASAYDNVAMDYSGHVQPLRIKFHHDTQMMEMFLSKNGTKAEFDEINDKKITNDQLFEINRNTMKLTNGFFTVESQVSNKDASNILNQAVNLEESISSFFGTSVSKELTRKQIVDKIISLPFIETFQFAHQKGPDYIIPTDDLITSSPSGAVKIKLASSGLASEKPVSVVTFLERTAKKFPDHNALAIKRKGTWVRWTYTQYWNDVCTAAKGLIKLGLEPFNSVGILGFNAPEWFISELATIFAGGMSCGIYTTNSPEACLHVLQDSRANIVVVENETQLKKIVQIRSKLPHLKAIIQYVGEPTTPGVLSWNDLMDIGRSVPNEILERRIRGQAVNQCCSLVYTSGTTGNAKGVMLSHDNVTFLTLLFQNVWSASFGNEIFVSYLPLSHVAAKIADLFSGIFYAAEVYFAPPDALKGSLVETLKEVRPTRLLGVPRVWEKMAEKLKEAEGRMPPVKKAVFAWSRKLATRYNKNRMNGSSSSPFLFSVADKFILKKVRQALGFERTLTWISGAAPISRETLDYFASLNMVITEVFGMSECTGPHISNFEKKFKLGSVGLALPGLEIKIENPDEKGNGELCLNGRNVFMGYLNNLEKTNETVDEDGWLHTGDIGNVDKHKFVSITGRIKELLITAGGENVAPVPIEDNVKRELPIVSNCVLIGDKRKFLSMLITLKTDVDMNTLIPKDKLSPLAKEWCHSVGSSAATVSDVLSGPDEKVMAAIQSGINRANAQAVSNAQRIQKWVILPVDFSIPGGELGPTLKVKRPVVHQKYKDTIEKIYEEC